MRHRDRQIAIVGAARLYVRWRCNAVYLDGGAFLKVSPLGWNGKMSAVKVIAPSLNATLDELARWGNARTA